MPDAREVSAYYTTAKRTRERIQGRVDGTDSYDQQVRLKLIRFWSGHGIAIACIANDVMHIHGLDDPKEKWQHVCLV